MKKTELKRKPKKAKKTIVNDGKPLLKTELEIYEQIQEKEKEIEELRKKAGHWTMEEKTELEEEIEEYLKGKEMKATFENEEIAKSIFGDLLYNKTDVQNAIKDFLESQRKADIEEELKFLEDFIKRFRKIINWENQRGLMPYDWNDYGLPFLNELDKRIAQIKKECIA